MVPDADLNGPAWTTTGDPRLTRVGKILRRTAIDELPEIWNVLKGDMSFVGPRPLNEKEQKELERHIPGFNQRLKVRPGLTGMAQVYDSADDSVDKLKYDLEYLKRLSPWLDVKLIVLSARNTLGARWDRRSGKPRDIVE
jgi:lipopolysaccharide/colanic/teichoic acid biosynthesis glycosyltransferase